LQRITFRKRKSGSWNALLQGKLQGQTLEDALALGKDNGIRKAETTLDNHLAEWGLLEQRKNVSFRIGDTIFENVRVEKAYKGNYHLLCEAEGKEGKEGK